MYALSSVAQSHAHSSMPVAHSHALHSSMPSDAAYDVGAPGRSSRSRMMLRSRGARCVCIVCMYVRMHVLPAQPRLRYACMYVCMYVCMYAHATCAAAARGRSSEGASRIEACRPASRGRPSWRDCTPLSAGIRRGRRASTLREKRRERARWARGSSRWGADQTVAPK